MQDTGGHAEPLVQHAERIAAEGPANERRGGRCALVAHTWEFNTSFDKENEPKMIKAVFKITTLTSDHMGEKIRMLVRDFGKNAEALEERLKK